MTSGCKRLKIPRKCSYNICKNMAYSYCSDGRSFGLFLCPQHGGLKKKEGGKMKRHQIRHIRKTKKGKAFIAGRRLNIGGYKTTNMVNADANDLKARLLPTLSNNFRRKPSEFRVLISENANGGEVWIKEKSFSAYLFVNTLGQFGGGSISAVRIQNFDNEIGLAIAFNLKEAWKARKIAPPSLFYE